MYSTNYRYFDKRELTPLGLPEATDLCFLFQFYHFSQFKITIKTGLERNEKAGNEAQLNQGC